MRLTRYARATGLIFMSLLLSLGCKKSVEYDIPEAPSLEGSSSEPVLLRYNFVPGDRMDWSMTMSVDMNAEAAGESIEMAIESEMAGDYVVQRVDSRGWGEVMMRIGRMTFDMSGGGAEMHYDSTDPSGSSRELSMMSELVEEPIELTISPRGEMDDSDVNELMSAFGGMGGGGGDMHNQIINSSFVAFPEQPVGVGDIYDGGSVAMPTAQGSVEVSARYEILSISGDGSQVLLKPHIDIASAFEALPGFAVDGSAIDGWMLFDVEKGEFTRYAMGMRVDFSVSQAGESGSGSMAVSMVYEVDNFERGTGVPSAPFEPPPPVEETIPTPSAAPTDAPMPRPDAVPIEPTGPQ